MKLKKLLLVGAIVGAVIIGTKVTRSFSHVREDARAAISWVESQVPMEKKFKQLRHEANGIDKDMDKVKNELAREIVEVRELTQRTAELRATIAKESDRLTAQGERITEATQRVSYGKIEMSVAEATVRLQKDVNQFVRTKKNLELMEKTLVHRETIKDTLQKTLDSMKTKKAEVLAEIDEAEAQYKELTLANVESKYQADDTRLAKIKERLRGLKKEVDIEKEKLALSPRVMEETPATSTKSVQEILAPLSKAEKTETIEDAK
ncbi:MAG: hypothetical protein ACRC8S_03725 [Fimbriiglobus sp.]